MGHLHMIQQWVQSTRNKPPDTDLEDKCKSNVYFYTTVDPIKTKEGHFWSDLCGRFLIISREGNKYIYVMYLYDFHAILTTTMKKRSDNEMIEDFTEFRTDIKIHGINPVLHFIDNEALTEFKMSITTMDVNWQLVPPINHSSDNAKRSMQTFKNHFISGLCIVDEKFRLQFWDWLLQQAIISLNLLRQSRIHIHLSSYTHIFGKFEYNCTPLAPPGTRVAIQNSLK